MHRTRALGRDVTRNTTRERKLCKEIFHTLFVLTNVWVGLAIGSLKIRVCHQCRPAVPWTRNIQHIEVKILDDAIEVYVNKILSRCCPPMPEQGWLHV